MAAGGDLLSHKSAGRAVKDQSVTRRSLNRTIPRVCQQLSPNLPSSFWTAARGDVFPSSGGPRTMFGADCASCSFTRYTDTLVPLHLYLDAVRSLRRVGRCLPPWDIVSEPDPAQAPRHLPSPAGSAGVRRTLPPVPPLVCLWARLRYLGLISGQRSQR